MISEGNLRIDVNISIRDENNNLGPRTEIKNVGSIHGVVHAIVQEKKRQINIIEGGGIVQNETFAWDAVKNSLTLMRDKEEANDYRFVPEPNLPPLRLIINNRTKEFHKDIQNKENILDLKHIPSKVPETPQNDRLYLIEKYGLSDVYAYNLVVSLINTFVFKVYVRFKIILPFFISYRQHSGTVFF